jgi:dihydrofolate reductase
MGRVVVLNHVTLDGVMQAPGRPDEDTRGGFSHGGWAEPDNDDVMGATMAEGFGDVRALVLGKRTYLDWFGYWPTQDSHFTSMLTQAQKYVASTTLSEPLPWQNSSLLRGDAAAAVAKLRAETQGDLLIMGSGELIQSLMRRSVIDDFVLMIHPVVLGRGRRLFTAPGAAARLELRRTVTTSKGVVIAFYRAAS